MNRNRLNYLLASECKSEFVGVLSESVTGIFVGLRHRGQKLYQAESNEPKYRSDLEKFVGGPLFVYFHQTRTVLAWEIDAFLDSLVLRRFSASPYETGFLQIFYEEDSYVPAYLRATELMEVTKEFGLSDKPLTSVRVFKLPNNFRSMDKDFAVAAGRISPTECAVEMKFDDNTLLVAHRMNELRGGHCFMTWDQVAMDFPVDDLEICLKVGDTGDTG